MEDNIKDESCGKKCNERKGTSEECEKKRWGNFCLCSADVTLSDLRRKC